ncbi:hypothetical protein [Mesorhizobium loti]|nr:hypothetical protein [Mesorhizobium loti]QKC70749.1 hypothetical protein EB815_17655 [Mesorhizobium loti]
MSDQTAIVLMPSEYLNPDWDVELPPDAIDWRRYIGGDLMDAWQTFTPEQRRLLAENSYRIREDELNGWPED